MTGLTWLIGSEWFLVQFFPIASSVLTERSAFELAFFTAGTKGSLFALYPMTHWLAMMLLGWGFGRYLLARPSGKKGQEDTEKLLLLSGPVRTSTLVVREIEERLRKSRAPAR